VIGELIERARLESSDITDMYRLFTSHFERVSESRFREDLDNKDWVIRIRDESALLGFTSLRRMHVNVEGETLGLLYSGDTIVKPEARSTTLLARTWIESVGRISEQCGTSDLHWFLLVSGFRTYRLLPVFWKEFFPNYRDETPASVRSTIDGVARRMFGADYDRDRRVVRFKEPQALRAELAAIPESRLSDPHVRFFASVNPRHAEGDELVCWTRLSEDNLTDAGARMWGAAQRASPVARLG
jgi:hypothetical protein